MSWANGPSPQRTVPLKQKIEDLQYLRSCTCLDIMEVNLLVKINLYYITAIVYSWSCTSIYYGAEHHGGDEHSECISDLLEMLQTKKAFTKESKIWGKWLQKVVRCLPLIKYTNVVNTVTIWMSILLAETTVPPDASPFSVASRVPP